MTKNLLHCTACGTQSEAKCKCGKPYIHVPARQAASLGVAAHPDWSDRRIAKAVGCHNGTVSALRKSSVENSTDASQRISSDGRKRSGPKKATKMTKPKKTRSKIDIPPAARDQNFTPREEWEMSLIQLTTYILTMDKVWTEKFGDWKQFQMTACTYKSITRAGVAWKELVNSSSPKLIINNDKEVSNVVSNQQ